MNNIDVDDRTAQSKKLLLAGIACILFIAYGSLVPLEFAPGQFPAAWDAFLATSFRPFDADSRSDWIANILLYVPVGYLLSAGFCASRGSVSARALAACASFLTSAAVAFVVEFAQLFFPARTASLSDIAANCVGAGLGIIVWSLWGRALGRQLADVSRGGAATMRAAMVLYGLAYLSLSLFPYDFFLSATEFWQKLASDRYGVLFAPLSCTRSVSCAAKLAVEVIAVVPFGVLLGIVLGPAARRAYSTAALTGLALGLAVETSQFFIASGVSQGASLLTRAAGLVLGVVLHRHVSRQWLLALRLYALPATLLAAVPYLLGLMWVNGWFASPWGGLTQAVTRLEQVHWPPFYYHYYSSESTALVSTLACIAMYAPLGIGSALIGSGASSSKVVGTATIAAFIAAGLAGIMELGKLFAPGQHPDPTNILIGAAAAAVACRLTQLLGRGPWMEGPAAPSTMTWGNPEIPMSAGPRFRNFVLAALVLAVAVYAIYRHPLPRPWLLLGLAGYAAILWRYPLAWVTALVASLPLLDLSPWTGWLMADEFDLLVLVTVGVRLCRPVATGSSGWPAGWSIIGGLLLLSFLVSTGIGLWPLQPWDANAVSSYYSHYNALRVAKGALWALCLLWLAASERDADLRRRFTLGMVAGLTGTLAVIVWERLAFTGLFNFSHGHRVSGPFPALHIGGSSLECYLVAALPFLGFAILTTRRWGWRLGGLLLAGVAVYGVMVTYSRAGFAALAVVGALMGVAFVRHGQRGVWNRTAYAVLGLLFLIGTATVAAPLLRGSFAQERLAQSEQDLENRFAYWRNALAIMDDDWRTRLFGMGLGRFPETFFWRSTVGDRPATYRFESENGNLFLRLGSGSPLYLNQIVALKPHHQYTLSLDARSSAAQGAGGIDVPICAMWVVTTSVCKWLRFDLKPVAGTWQHYEIAFDSDTVGAGPWYSRRPVVISLHNSAGIVDVNNVSLIGKDGRDLLSNGDFEHGGERWWFSVDDNLPWHIENFWLHVYFEQGLLGLLAVAALAACALATTLRRMWAGDLYAGTLFASIAGFLVVGMLNSPNDNPQLLFLFLVLCGLAGRSSSVAVPEFAGKAPDESARAQRFAAQPGAITP